MKKFLLVLAILVGGVLLARPDWIVYHDQLGFEVWKRTGPHKIGEGKAIIVRTKKGYIIYLKKKGERAYRYALSLKKKGEKEYAYTKWIF